MIQGASFMKRRNFLKTVGVAGAAAFGTTSMSSLLASCAADKKTWNVVFILIDDLAWNQVGFHGSTFYETPNIDAIAKAGMQFTDAYAANPVCSPTRASIMTGKNPARLHITDYIPGSPYPYAKTLNPTIRQNGLPLEETTLAEIFKKHGYRTGHFGKWHLNKDKDYEPGRPGDPASQGFDEVFTSVKPEYDADPAGDAHHAKEINRLSVEFIEKNKSNPFFCHVSHHVVHRPIMEAPELVAKYEAKPGSDDPVNNPIMGAMLETLDNGIGDILAKLDELKLTDNTIVVFASDNGGFEQLQEQDPLRGGKAMVFEGGIKVPQAIKWPGVIKPGTKCTTPVISDDFFPTFAEILEEKNTDKDIDGLSLMPLLKQSGGLDRDALYFHYPHWHHLGYKPAGAIREGKYKLIEWFEKSKTGEEGAYSLFDVEADEGESNDLSAEMPELVERLKKKLHDWRKRVNAQEMTVNPNYDPERADWRFEDRKGWYIEDGVVRT